VVVADVVEAVAVEESLLPGEADPGGVLTSAVGETSRPVEKGLTSGWLVW
jgi:hypothetical protein